MMKNKVNWEEMTLSEAQELVEQLSSAFSLTAKCFGLQKEYDVSYLTVIGPYDDNLHTEASKREL